MTSALRTLAHNLIRGRLAPIPARRPQLLLRIVSEDGGVIVGPLQADSLAAMLGWGSFPTTPDGWLTAESLSMGGFPSVHLAGTPHVQFRMEPLA